MLTAWSKLHQELTSTWMEANSPRPQPTRSSWQACRTQTKTPHPWSSTSPVTTTITCTWAAKSARTRSPHPQSRSRRSEPVLWVGPLRMLIKTIMLAMRLCSAVMICSVGTVSSTLCCLVSTVPITPIPSFTARLYKAQHWYRTSAT